MLNHTGEFKVKTIVKCENNGSKELTDLIKRNNCLSPLTLCHWDHDIRNWKWLRTETKSVCMGGL